jgi:hypothetical protein
VSFLGKLFGQRHRSAATPPPSDPIDAFWTWWHTASAQVARGFDSGEGLTDELIEEITEHVKAMHEDLAWETGAGETSDHHFALSAEGDAELRVLTQRWLARAPKPSQSWEYYPARQASGKDPRSTLQIEERVYNFADFRVAAEVDVHRAVVDVVVYHPHFEALEKASRSLPTFLFLDNLLGEDGVTSWLGSIEPSDDPSGKEVDPSELRSMVRSLKDTWDDNVVSLLQGERDELPFIVAFRLQLKRLDHLLFDRHLELELALSEPTERGLHFAEEGEELNDFEDALIQELGHNAVWIGHETHAGKRLIHFHGDGSPNLQATILQFCEAHSHWQSELRVTHDPSWKILKRY